MSVSVKSGMLGIPEQRSKFTVSVLGRILAARLPSAYGWLKTNITGHITGTVTVLEVVSQTSSNNKSQAISGSHRSQWLKLVGFDLFLTFWLTHSPVSSPEVMFSQVCCLTQLSNVRQCSTERRLREHSLRWKTLFFFKSRSIAILPRLTRCFRTFLTGDSVAYLYTIHLTSLVRIRVWALLYLQPCTAWKLPEKPSHTCQKSRHTPPNIIVD